MIYVFSPVQYIKHTGTVQRFLLLILKVYFFPTIKFFFSFYRYLELMQHILSGLVTTIMGQEKLSYTHLILFSRYSVLKIILIFQYVKIEFDVYVYLSYFSQLISLPTYCSDLKPVHKSTCTQYTKVRKKFSF